VHRWEVTDQVVYTQVGWLTRTWRIVPIARIQTVDTTRGPLQQLLGLATIIVRTASHAGSTDIEHLDAATADAVAHDLALRANAVRDEVT
jgi:membrane protein YdbS with pleckstrin-like domain